MSEELRPCRACRSVRVSRAAFKSNGGHTTYCASCAASTPAYRSQDEADTAWNDMNRPEEAPPKTVRVRILVAVDPEGYWLAYGRYPGGSPADTIRYLWGSDASDTSHCWIEADVPLPEPEITVQGRVTDD